MLHPVTALAMLGDRSTAFRPKPDKEAGAAVDTFEARFVASRPAACGRAELLANFGRRGMGRIPRKCELRGPFRVTVG